MTAAPDEDDERGMTAAPDEDDEHGMPAAPGAGTRGMTAAPGGGTRGRSGAAGEGQPGIGPAPGARVLLRIVGLWRRQAGWLGLGLLISLGSVAAGILLVAQSGRTLALTLVAGVLAPSLLLRLLGIGRTVLRYLERLVTHEATFRALADLRVWFFRGLAGGMAGGLGYLRAGDMLQRLVNDVEALDGLYLRIAVPGIAGLLLVLVLPWALAPFGAVAGGAIVLIFLLTVLIIPLLAARSGRAGSMELAASGAALRIALLDLTTGLREVRALGGESQMLAEIGRREADIFRTQARLARRAAGAQAVSSLLGQAAFLVALVAALMRGAADPVAATGLVFFLLAGFELVAMLPRAGVLAGQSAASAERVLNAVTPPPLLAAPYGKAPASSALRFDQIRFGWEPDRPAVFDGLSLDLPRGARIAVLGPSGSGKSTLAALALQVARPQAGRVLLGGADTALMDPAEIRGRFSWLAQATHLFADTIRANLLLARPEADEAALWAALDGARIGDLVRGLPGGLDAWLGENGATLSGGQARRLALARALLSTAPILILDEPCAGLDAETEAEFFATLNEVTGSRSLLLIAHRLTGAERLDRVYRLSAGHAVAAAR